MTLTLTPPAPLLLRTRPQLIITAQDIAAAALIAERDALLAFAASIPATLSADDSANQISASE